jgi:neopullulanase
MKSKIHEYKKQYKIMSKKILLLLLSTTALFAQIERVEPPFWYAGMKNTDLQILFYGKNIAENAVSVSNKIKIKEIKKTENPNYLFVTIDMKNVASQDITFKFSNIKSKSVFTQNYSLKKRNPNSANRKSFDASDMIYLIMPDRFANGNPNNDSTENTAEKANRADANGRHGGDIEGIMQNLNHIKALGATAVWPTPLCEDNQKNYSYHGYAQTDLYKIDPRYGTNEDYARLATELHKKDMKLIMDYVTNHWGSEHWMIKDLPTIDWIHQFPAFTRSTYKMETQYDSHVAQSDKKACVDGWFDTTMPDMNQSNPLLLKYITQNAIWWIEFADLDGFRVDTYSYNDKEGIAKWTKSITDEYPNFNIVGEVWMHNQANIAYWQKDSKIGAIQGFNSNLPSVMDFTLHDAINHIFNEDNNNWNDGLRQVYSNFTNDFLYPNPNNIMTFAENHDTDRINKCYNGDFKKYAMAMALIATVRGYPQLYYGSEIGMTGDKGKGDGDIRKDFPGGWAGDTNNAFVSTGRTEEQQKYFYFTAKLFQWRKSNKAVHFGEMKHYLPENNVYVYFRTIDKQSVMVVMNNSGTIQTIKTDRYNEAIGTFKTGKDVLTGKQIDLKTEFLLESKTFLILELQ